MEEMRRLRGFPNENVVPRVGKVANHIDMEAILIYPWGRSGIDQNQIL